MFSSHAETEDLQPEEATPETVIASSPGPGFNQRPRFLLRPHLPRSLILIALLLIITNAYVVLINQPASYWLDASNAIATAPVIHKILVNGPFVFAGISVIYLLLAWLAIAFLPRYPALVLWMVICFIHLRDAIQWSKCGLNQVYYDTGNSLVCGVVDFLLAVIGAGILGLILASAWFGKQTPMASEDQTALQTKQRPSRIARIAAIIWILLLTIVLIQAVIPPDSGWLPITTQNAPAPRVDGKIAFDTNRGNAVLFGGGTAWVGESWLSENDTWEWDGIDWEQRFPEISPPPRISHAMAYDEVRGVTVLFGGSDQQIIFNDTWEWDGEKWELRYPQISPPARCCHQMYFDSDTGKVRLYGGYDGGEIFYDDIWEWDGQEWYQVDIDSASPEASGFGLAYDRNRHQLSTFLSSFENATWILHENRWSNPQMDPLPPQRSSASMAYDITLQKSILFGGAWNPQLFNDTWLLGDEWQELDSHLVPQARWGHTLYYDGSRGRIVMFGGFDGQLVLNDMWELVVTEP